MDFLIKNTYFMDAAEAVGLQVGCAALCIDAQRLLADAGQYLFVLIFMISCDCSACVIGFVDILII